VNGERLFTTKLTKNGERKGIMNYRQRQIQQYYLWTAADHPHMLRRPGFIHGWIQRFAARDVRENKKRVKRWKKRRRMFVRWLLRTGGAQKLAALDHITPEGLAG
jgi:hypothetical protein